MVDGTTKANVIDEDDDRSTPEGRARYMAARRASAVPSVEGPGRHWGREGPMYGPTMVCSL